VQLRYTNYKEIKLPAFQKNTLVIEKTYENRTPVLTRFIAGISKFVTNMEVEAFFLVIISRTIFLAEQANVGVGVFFLFIRFCNDYLRTIKLRLKVLNT
jgi:hypothetical protein